jgi:hypothetical protein
MSQLLRNQPFPWVRGALGLGARGKATALLLATQLLVSCHFGEPCREIDYDPGDQFRVTVLSANADNEYCADVRLAEGSSYVVTAGKEGTGSTPDCGYTALKGDTATLPPELAGFAMVCGPSGDTQQSLEVTCTGTHSGEPITVYLAAGGDIGREHAMEDRGRLLVRWSSEGINEPCSNPQDHYTARIEYLGPPQ